ncbi:MULTISPECIES: ribonuclease G [unclassified Enterococcus]|uniref:ribonuclease G n=1 Tax=unclassified Enterococcus TaxID=2608891 RepID=UPI00155164F9|nr:MULTISPECIES: ribonuclease G [unclassified Enterococcus]MBS7576012.1 ribonuclease G [Enterococcus sp. MMGLQ5-2]MBS7583245.1 ribonuclease G [Enterococcus sp. MMGLQ5-1]NPD11105.1 ribonuclease G [Enterococcus sp. MMGLQ5-1]NPD35848.1 ribonuclease G [Enterococcus sp. MMGLQ5-2]
MEEFENEVNEQPVTANTNEVPAEVKKWNWGAFILNIYWGIGNKTYLPLLCLIPLFNLIWMFVCGAKGNEWAWRDGNYQPEDLETFKKVQATWNRAGLVMFIINCVLIVLLTVFYIAIFSFIINNINDMNSYNYSY